jgi:type IV pilus assembly protein PilQ
MNATKTWNQTAKGIVLLGILFLIGSWQQAVAAVQPINTLKSIDFAGLPGDQVQITFSLSQAATSPASFTIDNPARIALDLPNTKSDLKQRSQAIGVGPAKSITAVEVKDRTRVVVNLVEMVPYETRTEGNQLIVVLGKGSGTGMMAASGAPAVAAAQPASSGAAITNVDFRRGDDGEGRIIISLSDPAIPVDMNQQGGKVVLDFRGASLAEELQRRLDVTDFATPVKIIDTEKSRTGTHMEITAIGDYEHLAYQSDNELTVEIRKTTKEEQEARKKAEFGYTGERLSLNFQDIEVRAVLQLLADFTGTNIVVSDSVSGSLTLRMQNVPWDQALDIVLRTKGLDKRQNGNVLLIAPSAEIAAREKLELESQKQIEELAPLYSDFIQVNYAKAAELAALLKSADSSLMSDRGKVTIDERTNTLLLQDTSEKLEQIRRMVARLDIPVRQVLIESRIVLAKNDFARDLGVKFGWSRTSSFDNDKFFTIGGKQPGDTDYGGNTSYEVPGGSGLEGLITDLPALDPSGSIGLAIGRIGSHLLQLELSAMQLENRGELVSSPRVITSNQQEALIRQGVEIPYQEASSSGATAVTFKEAVLQLKVTPQITPDDHIIMELDVSKDSVGEVFNGVPSIDTRNVQTSVLVDNGETLVLGGIYEQARANEVERVPFFGELPGLSWLFKTERKTDDKSEMLIFVTPKIVKEGIALN